MNPFFERTSRLLLLLLLVVAEAATATTDRKFSPETTATTTATKNELPLLLGNDTPNNKENDENDNEGLFHLMDIPSELISKHKAYCLDGSPYKYYFRRTSVPGHENDYVLYFQGGGWCYTMDDCYKRSLTNLGSSRGWQALIPGDDGVPTLIHNDPDENPLFAFYNHIFLPYCDGASFSGNQADAVDGLWFRGKHNLDVALEHLGLTTEVLPLSSWSLSNFTLSTTLSPSQDNDKQKMMTKRAISIRNVLVTGCSAGGLAVYLHSDDIRQRLLDSSDDRANVRALAESGMFLFHDTVEGKPVYEHQLKRVFEMQNSTNGVNGDCIQGQISTETHYRCISAMTTLQYLKTSIFMFNSIYDSWSIQCIWTADENACAAAAGWHDCALNLANCSQPQRVLIGEWGDAVVDALVSSGALSHPGNGAFLHSCFTHCSMDWNRDILHTLTIRGTTLGHALADWWNDGNNNNDTANHHHTQAPRFSHPHFYWPCRIRQDGDPMCNPTCKKAILDRRRSTHFLKKTG